MASWKDVFSVGNTNDGTPEWMFQHVGTAAAQVIWYPGQTQANVHGNHHVIEDPAPGPQANYRVYRRENHCSKEYTVELLRVPICCENCADKIKSRLFDIDGVQGVSVDQERKLVTVSGTAELKEILNVCKKTFERSRWRPY